MPITMGTVARPNLTPWVPPPPPGVGIFGGGYAGGNSDYTDKYTYADDTVAAGTVLGTARRYLAACSPTANGL